MSLSPYLARTLLQKGTTITRRKHTQSVMKSAVARTRKRALRETDYSETSVPTGASRRQVERNHVENDIALHERQDS